MKSLLFSAFLVHFFINIVPKTLETPSVLVFDVCSQTIVAMDQIGGDDVFGTVPVDVEKLEEGYAIAVAMGGTDVSKVAKYLVTYNAEEETIIVYGDVDGSGVVDTTDAAWVLSKFANSATVFPCGNDDAGDVDGSGAVDTTDAAWILSKFANSSTVFPVEQQ